MPPSKNPQNPHDRFFKATFSMKSVAKAFIKHFLPKEILEGIDLRTFKREKDSFIDEKLEEHFADLVYSCKNSKEQSLKIAFLFEHKSYPDKYIHFQLLRYFLNHWESERKQNVKKLSLVIPIVFYHGSPTWRKKPLSEHFKGYSDYNLQFVPQLEYLLIDLNQYSDEEILRLKVNFLVNGLILLKHKLDKDYVFEQKERIFFNILSFIETVDGLAYYKSIFVYLIESMTFEKPELEFLIKNSPNKLKKMAMNTIDLLKQEGREEVVKIAILEFPELSDERISKLVDGNLELVKRLRKELENGKKSRKSIN